MAFLVSGEQQMANPDRRITTTITLNRPDMDLAINALRSWFSLALTRPNHHLESSGRYGGAASTKIKRAKA